MKDAGKLTKNLIQLQMRMTTAQNEIAATEFEAKSGGGALKIKVNGKHEVLNVEVSPELLKEDTEVVADVIKAAFSNVHAQIEAKSKEKLQGLAGGLIPAGFKIPGITA